MNTSMNAQVLREYGAPSNMTWETVLVPTPGPGEVLLKVHAAGINPIDWKTRAGHGLGNYIPNMLPWIPGWDVSGVVEALGEGVTDFAVGDAAFGMVRFPEPAGAYAEYMVAPATHLVSTPAGVSTVDAAGAPLAVLTAWQALFDVLDIQAGERVFVHGASGGVGRLATQIAAWHGAHVIGSGSAANLDSILAAGASEAIDYRVAPFAGGLASVDKVFDAAGGPSAALLYPLLKHGGAFASIAGGVNEELAAAHGVTASGLKVHVDRDQLARIAGLIADGTVTIQVARTFDLADAAAAHEFGETPGKAAGKIVLVVPGA